MLDMKMPELNAVLIAGNLINDPSFRTTANGTPVVNFCIAANRRFKDSSGQWREAVCYIGVVAWYKLAESCYGNLKKGSAVLVEGELQSRTWKNEDGSEKNIIEIKAKRIQFLHRPVRDALSATDGRDLRPAEQSRAPNASENQIPMDSQTNGQKQDSPNKFAENNDAEFDFGHTNLNKNPKI